MTRLWLCVLVTLVTLCALCSARDPLLQFQDSAAPLDSHLPPDSASLATGNQRAFVTELLFLGTGPSDGVPNLPCALGLMGKPCKVCADALHNHPSKNKRGNTSMLVKFIGASGQPR